MTATLVIAIEDPRCEDIVGLLAQHLDFAAQTSPPEHVHALDLEGLVQPNVTFFAARRDGELLGVAALKELDRKHGELKSMHTAHAARNQGVGRALVNHLLAVARERGYERVSLETGSMDDFAAARALYAKAGFTNCPPFADYTDNEYSTCMSIAFGTGAGQP